MSTKFQKELHSFTSVPIVNAMSALPPESGPVGAAKPNVR